ncbi:MAG: hypothetical protein Q9160_003850 [Pyrenula sp. 1 TL-2023]
MKQLILAFAICALSANLPSSSGLSLKDKPHFLTREENTQTCVATSPNGRNNPIPLKVFRAFTDACKSTIYSAFGKDGISAKLDTGDSLFQSFSYSSNEEAWSITFDATKSNDRKDCLRPDMKIKCSDLVGKSGNGQDGDIGRNIAFCSDQNKQKAKDGTGPKQDVYYHGGEIKHYWFDPGNVNQEHQCGTTIIKRIYDSSTTTTTAN